MFGNTDIAGENLLKRDLYFGKYKGFVTNVDDPLKMGRIKARVPKLLGKYETNWAIPCTPFAGEKYGIQFIPNPGDGVWIEFEGGDIDKPIYTGFWWASGELPYTNNEDINEFNHEKRFIWLPGDIYIEIFSKEGEEHFYLVHKKTGTRIQIDSSGMLYQFATDDLIVEGDNDIIIKNKAYSGTDDYIKLEFNDDPSSPAYTKMELKMGNNNIILNKSSNELTVTADGDESVINIESQGIDGVINIKSQGTDGVVNIDSDSRINFGSGANPIARQGDQVEINVGGTIYTGTIIEGSGKVYSE